MQEIVKPHLFRTLPNPVFQQGNARQYIARVTLKCTQCFNVNLLPWSVRYPDLLPIKQVWSIIIRHSVLHLQIQVARNEVSQDEIDHFMANQ